MPSSTPTWASLPEVQQLTVAGTRTLRTIQYRYSWPIGSDTDHIARIVLTAANAGAGWALNDPRAGRLESAYTGT